MNYNTSNQLTRFEKHLIAMRYWLKGKEFFRANQAMELALSLHDGVRRDGSPEFSHQLSIAHYVKTISKSLEYLEDTFIVSFFHDSTEDGKISEDELIKLLGVDITTSIQKVSKFIPKSDNMKKPTAYYYERISECPIASIVKGADRIHNLQTMQGAFTNKKKWIYLEETELLVLPMLKQARRTFPKQELAYENIKYILENQIALLKKIDFLDNEG